MEFSVACGWHSTPSDIYIHSGEVHTNYAVDFYVLLLYFYVLLPFRVIMNMNYLTVFPIKKDATQHKGLQAWGKSLNGDHIGHLNSTEKV